MKKLIKIKSLLLIAIKSLNIAIFNIANFYINIKILKCKIFYASIKEIFRIIYKKKNFKKFTLKEIKKKLIKYILFK